MDQLANKSEVAQFVYEQALQEEAANLAIYGPAVVANHEAINARMNKGATLLLELIAEGKYKEVALLMETKSWE